MVTNQAGILLSLFVFVQSPKSHEGSKFWSLVANEPPTGWTEQFFFRYLSPCRHATVSRFFLRGHCSSHGAKALGRCFARGSVHTAPIGRSPSSTQGLFPLGAFNDVCAATRVTSLTLSDTSACGIYVCFLCCTVPEK